jgi:hypothetical protein
MPPMPTTLRQFFRAPIPEIEAAARHLDAAISAHLCGAHADAAELLRMADDRTIWAWLESVWGAKSPYTHLRTIPNTPPIILKGLRAKPRQAPPDLVRLVHERDGHYCRFCKIPVVSNNIRKALRKEYPEVVPWSEKDGKACHAALQCMWAQYDHIFPHCRGGTTTIDNICLTCAACNYGRGPYTLEEVGMMHPDSHEPRRGDWDGLERLRRPGRAVVPRIASVMHSEM